MNKFKSLVLAAIGLLCSISVSAEDFEVDGIYYNIISSTDKTVEVTYRGSSYNEYSNEYSGDVTIPESVTYNENTYSVTRIGNYAFSRCSGLTSVVIPNSVTRIGESVFFGCSSLTCVEIPNSVISIWDYAFYGCSSLTFVEIPNSVISIRDYAFSGCSKLRVILNKSGLYFTKGSSDYGDIAHNAEVVCNGYEQIDDFIFTEEDEVYYLRAYIGHETELELPINYNGDNYGIGDYAFSCCTSLTSVEIPNGVTSIDSHAFYDCSSLTSVVIGNRVTSIGEAAFQSCSSLTSIAVAEDNQTYDSRNNCNAIIETQTNTLIAGCSKTTIPNSVTSIGEAAFKNCSGLTSVEIPNSVTSIGEAAFENCSGLTSVEIPNSVTSIGDYAFYFSGLTSVEIPNGVKNIGLWAFSTPSITSVTIPSSVTTIEEYAFANLDRLTSVHIEDIAAWFKIKFGNEHSNPLNWAKNLYLNGEKLTELVIPNSVTSIGDYVFYHFSGLTSVKIPNSVTSIGKGAFQDCSGLTSVEIGNSVTSIGDFAFRGCSGLTSVVIPNSVTSIGDYAFEDCSGLTSVVIPNSVTSIGHWAFARCSGLTSITSLIPADKLFSPGYDAFYGVDKTSCTLYVPMGAKETYAAVGGWKYFTNIEELAPSHYELTDGVVYDRTSDCFVNSVTYTRNLPNLHWNALYVPFELPYDVVAEHYDVAYINDVNGYDTDDNGEIDDLAMEIIKIKSGTLKANYPYLIKAKTEADKAMNITVEDATLYAAEENSVDCSSVYQNYVVKGTYTKKTAEELVGKLAISTSGAWQPLAEGTALNPFRLYLSIENRDNSPLKVETSAMSRMRIVEGGETTGIEDVVPSQQREDVIFDLSGRRVKQPVKGGVYIVNGKKRIL